jgi:serine/threonine protein kinase
MSVVPGERFDKLFEPGSATTPLQAAQMVLAVLEEFQRIHALGIIHGDATPGNILLEKTNNPDHPYRARFIDFFLAYKKDKNATFYPYYDSGHVYFPPERARFDVRGLPSQDVFEFAGVLKSEIECDGNRDEDTKKLFPAIDKFIRQGKSLSPELRPELQDSISELKQQIHDYQKQYAPAHKRAIAHSEKLFEAAPATKKQRVAHERKCMKR